MKQDVICPVCKAIVGRVHGNEEDRLVSNHLLTEHPEAYKEIANVRALTDEIWKKYHVNVRYIFYYSLDRIKR